MTAEQILARLMAEARQATEKARADLEKTRRSSDGHRFLPVTEDELRHLAYLGGNHLAQEPCTVCRDLHTKIGRITDAGQQRRPTRDHPRTTNGLQRARTGQEGRKT